MSLLIRVVIADGSPLACRMLKKFLQDAGGFDVVAMATTGPDAFARVLEYEPDVVTVAMDLPGYDGLTTLDNIMMHRPTPVVMITGVGRLRANRTLLALERGAIDFVLKYVPGQELSPAELGRTITHKVRVAAGVKVIRRLDVKRVQWDQLRIRQPVRRTVSEVPEGLPQLVVIGASTGGPQALKELLARLPVDFPAAIVVVQHLPPTFTTALAETLNAVSGVTVREARNGDRLKKSTVYIAPGDQHLLVRADERLELSEEPPLNGYRPAIDITMNSAVDVFGPRVSGVILSGMGDDGLKGMAKIYDAGGLTLAQEASSCVVYGMPRRVIEAGYVECSGTPTELAEALMERVSPAWGMKAKW
ncbi:MAG: chemotaxis-specific protein-glutamate methyltransferase CheB [Fimbriiglobus sp.]